LIPFLPRRFPVKVLLALPTVLAVLTGCGATSATGGLRRGAGPGETGIIMPDASVNVSQLPENPEPAAPGSAVVWDGEYSYTPVGARRPGPWTALILGPYQLAVAPGTIVELWLHEGQYKPAVSGSPAVLQPVGHGKIRFDGVLWDVARFRAGAAGSTEITAVAPPCNELIACMSDYRLVIGSSPDLQSRPRTLRGRRS
jgi:hypothetical protein